MKKNLLLLMVLCLFAFSTIDVFAQNENSSLVHIEQNTENTAKNTKKGEYEILTIILSGLAFFTALVTLRFTIRTYKSQKKTQENTTPIFTREKQYEVFKALSERIIENYLEAGVVRAKMGTANSGIIPTEIFFPSFQLNSEELHMELFYDTSDDKLKKQEVKDVVFLYEFSEYAMVSNLKSAIDQYNDRRKILVSQIQQHKLDMDTIMQEYDSYVVKSIVKIINLLVNTSNKIFKEKEDMRCHIVRYLWARKAFFTSQKKFPDLFLKKEEITDKGLQESLSSFTAITINDWNTLFDGFDFSKAETPEKIEKIDDLIRFSAIAILGDMLKKYDYFPSYKYC